MSATTFEGRFIKHAPVIVGLITPLALGLWWMAHLDSRATDVERRIVALETRDEQVRVKLEQISADVAATRAQVTFLVDHLSRTLGQPK